MKTLLGTALLAISTVAMAAPRIPEKTPAGWLKGNTHTHTIWSDGD